MEWQGGGIMNCKFQPHKAHVPYLLQLLVPFSRLICCFLRQSISGLLMMIGYLTPCASHRLKLRLRYAFVWWFLGSQTSQILPSSQWLDCSWLDVFKFDCVLPHLIGDLHSSLLSFLGSLWWDTQMCEGGSKGSNKWGIVQCAHSESCWTDESSEQQELW